MHLCSRSLKMQWCEGEKIKGNAVMGATILRVVDKVTLTFISKQKNLILLLVVALPNIAGLCGLKI